MSGDMMLSCICMVQTAPMNTEITSTRGMESMPSLVISAIVRVKNIFQPVGLAEHLAHEGAVATESGEGVGNNHSMSIKFGMQI